MLSDDNIQNSILFRPNSKTERPPFLSGLQAQSKLFTAASSKTPGSRKSIRVLRPETLKRANNDACMAAAIGDLDWLKQTLKISAEIAYDKNVISNLFLRHDEYLTSFYIN